MQRALCPVCDEAAHFESQSGLKYFECPICGNFIVSVSLVGENFNYLAENDKEKIQFRYYFYTMAKDDPRRSVPIRTEEDKKKILSTIPYPKNLLEKIDIILLNIANRQQAYGEPIYFSRNDHRAVFCKDEYELDNIYRDFLTSELGYINETNNNLTAKGWIKALQLKDTNINSTQGFVAMWFSKESEQIRESIQKAISAAGYECMIIDTKKHDNFIPNEIRAEIRKSKFVVADFTGNRGGVYNEAGFAEGLNIPVFYTCKRDWFDDVKDENGNIIQNGVHFDLRQKPFIFWEDNEDSLSVFERELKAAIGALIGFNS